MRQPSYFRHAVREARRGLRRRLQRAKHPVSALCWAASGHGLPLRDNERRLARLRNREAGKRIFIVGNGPSLNATDVDRLCGEVTIASNGIFLIFDRKRFRPTYYTIEDDLVAEDRGAEAAAMKGCWKIFPEDVRQCIPSDEQTIYVNLRREEGTPRFSNNGRRSLYWGGTVTYMNMQLAHYLGAKAIYLVGFDHHYALPQPRDQVDGCVITSATDDVNHFDGRYFGPGYRWHDPQVQRMEASYRAALAFFKAHGVEVFNATAGGYLEVFPRVEFDSLFPPGASARVPD